MKDAVLENKKVKETKVKSKSTPASRAFEKRISDLCKDVSYPVQVSDPKFCMSTGLLCLDLIISGGIRGRRMYTITGLPEMGKCIKGGSLLFSDEGIIPIKQLIDTNLSPGFQEFKHQTKIVTNRTPEKPDKGFYEKTKNTIKIETKKGFFQEGTTTHKVLSLNRGSMMVVFKQLKDLKKGDYVGLARGADLWSKTNADLSNFSTALKYEYPKTMTEDLAWVCGVLIANESSFMPHVRKTFNNMIEIIFYNKDIKDFFKFIGLKKGANKEVPSSILRSPKNMVLSFIRGYLVNGGGTWKSCIKLNSISKKFIEQLQLMLLNLGIVSEKTAAIDDKIMRRCWYLSINDYYKFLEIFPDWNKRPKRPVPFKAINLLEKNWDVIESIKRSKKLCTVYDVSMTKDNPTFAANGLINHNSTLCQEVISSAQREKLLIFHFDFEGGSSKKYMEAQGISLNYHLDDGSKGYYYFNLETGDEGYQLAYNLLKLLPDKDRSIETPPTVLFIIDSYEAMKSKDIKIDENPIGAAARMHSRYQKLVRTLILKKDVAWIATNQLRNKIMSFGDPLTDAGGLAAQYYADVKIRITRYVPKLVGTKNICKMKMKCTKSKVGDPFHAAEFNLIIGKGFDRLADRLNFLVLAKAIDVDRGKYTIDGKKYNYATAKKRMKDKKWKVLARKLVKDIKTYEKYYSKESEQPQEM